MNILLVLFHVPAHVFSLGWQEYAVIALIVTAVSSFIIGVRMRREIKKSLGRKATEEDLADVDTWIQVRKAEEQVARGDSSGRPVKPL